MQPLMYNFYDLDYKDMICTGRFEYNDNIIINGSVPLEIMLAVELDKESYPTNQTGYTQLQDLSGYTNYNNIYDMVNGSCEFILQYVKVFVNGQLKKDLKNPTLFSLSSGNMVAGENSYESITNLQFEKDIKFCFYLMDDKTKNDILSQIA
jgi:hypothetical protein